MGHRETAESLLAEGNDHVADQLSLLAEMGRDFVSTGDLSSTLYRAVGRITQHLNAAGGALFLLDEAEAHLVCEACVGATNITGLSIPADQGIVGRCVQENSGEIVVDAYNDPSFNRDVDKKTGYRTQSILCAPMSVQGQSIGAIELINKESGDGNFDHADLQLLQVLSSSAAMAILNARMAEDLVEQERVQRELEMAAEIQRSLLPAEEPVGSPIFGLNVPARVVSGDFYDFFRLQDGRICFCLGDVSGKGMNAALLMAKTSSLFRCLGKTIQDPGRLLALINAEICETVTRGMFVTMAAGVYDPRTGKVRLANAGHEPPLVFGPDGNVSALPATAPPLGILPGLGVDDPIAVSELSLDGGRLYVFTDGVTEGYLPDGTEFGIDALKEVLGNPEGGPARNRVQLAVDKVNHFGGNSYGTSGGALRDDLTMISLDDELYHRDRDPNAAPASAFERDQAGEVLVSMTITARPDRLKVARGTVREAASLAGLDEAGAQDLVLAVDEALQNVIRHAYEGRDGEVNLVMRRAEDGLVVTLRDFAETVDPAKVKPRELDDIRPGGLGTHFIQQVMDQVEFLPPPPEGGNILRMVKRLP